MVLTLSSQLHRPPHASLPVAELDGVLARVFLCGLCDLQPQLISHHAALDTVREGDGRVPGGEATEWSANAPYFWFCC